MLLRRALQLEDKMNMKDISDNVAFVEDVALRVAPTAALIHGKHSQC